jgi:hypothetical protein
MQQVKAYGTNDVISQLVQLRVPGQQLSQLHKPVITITTTVPAHLPVARLNPFSILDRVLRGDLSLSYNVGNSGEVHPYIYNQKRYKYLL